jgi:hypothetical protein
MMKKRKLRRKHKQLWSQCNFEQEEFRSSGVQEFRRLLNPA